MKGEEDVDLEQVGAKDEDEERQQAEEIAVIAQKLRPVFAQHAPLVARFIQGVHEVQEHCEALVKSKSKVSKSFKTAMSDMLVSLKNVTKLPEDVSKLEGATGESGGSAPHHVDTQQMANAEPSSTTATAAAAVDPEVSSRLEAADARAMAAEKQVTLLQKQVAVYRQNAEEAAEKMASVHQDIEKFIALSDGHRKELENAQRELAGAKKELEETQGELRVVMKRAKDAEKQLEDVKKELTVRNKDNDTVTSKVQQLEKECEGFRTTANHSVEKAADLQYKLSAVQAERERLRKNLSDAEAKVASSEEQLSLSTSLMKEAKDTMIILNTELEAANATKEDLSKQLKISQDDTSRLKMELDTVNATKDELSKKLSKWDDVSKRQQGSMDSERALQRQLEATKLALAASEKQLTEHKSRFAGHAMTLSTTLEQQKDEIERTRKVVESLQNELAATRNELHTKALELERLKAQEAQVKEAYSLLDADRNNLYNQIKNLQKEAQDGYKRQAAEVTELQFQLHDQVSTQAKLREQAASTQQLVQELTQERNEWYRRAQTANEACSKMLGERNTTMEKLQALSRQYEANQAKIAEGRSVVREAKDALKKVSKLEDKTKQLQSQLSVQTKARMHLDKEVSNLRESLKAVGAHGNTSLSSQAKLLIDREQQLQQVQQNLRESEEKVLTCSEGRDEACSVVTSLTHALKQLYEQHLSAQASVVTLSARLESVVKDAQAAEAKWVRRLRRLRRLTDKQALHLCLLRYEAQLVRSKLMRWAASKGHKRNAKPARQRPAKRQRQPLLSDVAANPIQRPSIASFPSSAVPPALHLPAPNDITTTTQLPSAITITPLPIATGASVEQPSIAPTPMHLPITISSALVLPPLDVHSPTTVCGVSEPLLPASILLTMPSTIPLAVPQAPEASPTPSTPAPEFPHGASQGSSKELHDGLMPCGASKRAAELATEGLQDHFQEVAPQTAGSFALGQGALAADCPMTMSSL